MNERKIIQISPDLVRFSSTNKTKKKHKNADPNKPIKMKSANKPVSSKTVRNRLLKYIRQQQDSNYKQLSTKEDILKNTEDNSEFKYNFENSLNYLSSIAEKTKNVISPEYKRNNATLRHLPPTTESLLMGSTLNNGLFDTNVGLELPDVFNTFTPVNTDPPVFLRNNSNAPKFGCLKNGILPTYRMWKNQTMRVSPTSTRTDRHGDSPNNGSITNTPIPQLSNTYPNITISGSDQSGSDRSGSDRSGGNNSFINTPANMPSSASSLLRSNIIGGKKDDISEMKKHYERKKNIQQNQRPKNLFRKLKQKRILRRTYRVGKSKNYPNVSVLVSNKTLRNQTTTKTQLLKQVPMEDVKKTLIKKGFIKVGSTAPTDVLRKMYETVSLVCGDIQNHNPENLLYNYFNGGHDV